MHYQSQGALQPMDGDVKAFCQRYMNYQVMAQMNDGSQLEGIIDRVDEDGVTMLVPEDVDGEQMRQDVEDENARQFGYNYGRPRYRRFRRRRFPFPFISRLFLFPFYPPYPFPYYPWY